MYYKCDCSCSFLAFSPVLGGFITPAGYTKLLLEFSILLCCSHYYFLFLSVLLPMASFSRGQLPARQTKVVDESQHPLKTGSPRCGDLRNDVTSSKLCCKGRDVAEDFQGGACVVCCGSNRCKTCDHIFVGSTFTSNVTGKSYNVRCTGKNMNCGTKNVIYLISCRKCAVQYVGETSQTLRCRFNNHRSGLKQLCGLYLYHHFSSDGHTLDDISIMPIEVVVLEPSDVITLPSKRLQREEYWYLELCTVYPYGLNDNVKGIGNVSSRTDDGLVVYELFNKQKRKFRNRTAYKSLGCTFRFKTYFMNLPRNKLRVVVNVVEKLVLDEAIPTRIMMLVRDLMAFRLKINVTTKADNGKRESTNKKKH